MSLTFSFVVCYLSAINRGAAAPVDSVDEAAVLYKIPSKWIIPGFVISHVAIIFSTEKAH
jgi:hypothetical protein